jgi:HD-GYP domain-containing protein (c-di-GMP phosphodiesterase class II)
MGSLLGESAPAASAEASVHQEALYQKARQEVARIVEAATWGKPYEVSALQAVVAGLVEALVTEDGLLVEALESGETQLDLPSHMVNVAILAIKIGQGVGYGEEDLRRLALAGCLHDVGMVIVPRRVLEKSGALSADEAALIRQHPERGSRMLQTLGPEFEWLATVALQEQEREDGSGYPRGLKGDQIHEYAKIIGLADVYECLTHARPYRTMLVPYDLEEITRAEGRAFPDRILQAMIRALSGFPAGSSVRQGVTGEQAREHRQEPPVSPPATVLPLAASAPNASAEASVHPETLYQRARQEVARIVEAATAGKPYEVSALQDLASSFVEALATGDALLVQAMEATETHLDLPGHMVNVAILAIKIGQGVGYGEEDLRRLALAGCLHDVGMVIVPRRVLEKSGALSADEAALIRQHPERGSRMLQTLGPEFEWLATVALQEQEREDGSGYPRGLKGDQLHEYVKVIGLADIYEALTHPRPYQKQRVPFDAVKDIMKVYRRSFPDQILKGLIQGLSTFPVGSLVRLNSKEIARVVATNPAFPLRPVVEVLTGPMGDRLASARRVDLAQNSLVYITDSATNDAARRSRSD